MPACQEKSPTKITKITAAGRGGAHTYCLFPRPKVYSAQVQSSLPRTAVGVNEYFYALSLREHGAVRCVAAGSSIHLPLAPLTAVLPVGITRVALPPKPLRRGRAGGRVGASRWEVDVHTATPPLLIHKVKYHQQYEAPAAVVATVRRLWQPTFDAMATPLSAICAQYATLEDDVMTPDLIPRGSIIYVNPAYAPEDAKNGAAGIEIHLSKLVETDVRARGSKLIALLPNLSHTGWCRRLVGPCHEIHFISGTLVFSNPYTDLEPPRKGYLWQCRSYVLCVWRPSAPPAQPTLNWLDLDAAPTERMHLRLCAKCGRVRFLPRWVAKPESAKLRQGAFICARSLDAKYAVWVVRGPRVRAERCGVKISCDKSHSQTSTNVDLVPLLTY